MKRPLLPLSARRILRRLRKRVPPPLRIPLGFLLILGGLMGFLPVLGFWMVPLGLALVVLDLRPAARKRLCRQRRKAR